MYDDIFILLFLSVSGDRLLNFVTQLCFDGHTVLARATLGNRERARPSRTGRRLADHLTVRRDSRFDDLFGPQTPSAGRRGQRL